MIKLICLILWESLMYECPIRHIYISFSIMFEVWVLIVFISDVWGNLSHKYREETAQDEVEDGK